MTASAIPYSYYILYQKNKYKCINLEINIHTSSSDILTILNRFAFPGCPCPNTHIRFVIMELLDNSIRVQHCNEVNDNIIVNFKADPTKLCIVITDHGGGFISPSQQENTQWNFGMGLSAARKVFHEFTIQCHDGQGGIVPCNADFVAGTRIVLGITWQPELTGMNDCVIDPVTLELSI